MANLKRTYRWEKWAPNLGDNRELPEAERLHLELATGLTAAKLSEVAKALRLVAEEKFQAPAKDTPAESLEAAVRSAADDMLARQRRVIVAALSDVVRVRGGPHHVDGKVLTSLEDYVALAQGFADAGLLLLTELREALWAFNSVEGPDELF